MGTAVKDEAYYRGKLFAASWRGELDLVKEVIEANVVDVNVVDCDGVSALRHARCFCIFIKYFFTFFVTS
jgi:hypothetical protein